MARSVIVTLEPWEYERAFAVGIGRFVANWGKNDAQYYDRSKMQEDRIAEPAAAACELAVAKHLNQYWHASVWPAADHHKYRHLPDVGQNIEVRRVRTGLLTVRSKDAGKIVWAASEADNEFRTIEIWGWVEAVGQSDRIALIDLNEPGYAHA